MTSAFFSGATVQREYLALVEQSGQLAAQPQGTITDPLRGPGGSLQPAITLYETLSSNDKIALLRLTPQTGRCAITGCLLRPDHTANKSCTPSHPIPSPPPPSCAPFSPPPTPPAACLSCRLPTSVYKPVVLQSNMFRVEVGLKSTRCLEP